MKNRITLTTGEVVEFSTIDTPNEQLNNLIALTRAKLSQHREDLTLSKIAERSGITVMTLNNIIKGKNVSVEVLGKVLEEI